MQEATHATQQRDSFSVYSNLVVQGINVKNVCAMAVNGPLDVDSSFLLRKSAPFNVSATSSWDSRSAHCKGVYPLLASIESFTPG
mmetsp:Transcript_25864/g.39130  ORF Transcript_25864/g.39130 Transcript_25864/m.39130 type:complete len:85 (+) Transcript_25864:329-583(+)